MTYTVKILQSIVLILFPLSSLFCQIGISASAGAKSLAMGEAAVAFDDIDAIFSNQAGLTSIDGLAVQLHSERRFALQDLTTVSLGIAKGMKVGTIGLMVSSFGYESFRDQKIGLAYARKLFDNLSIGGQFDLLHTSIENYGSSTNFTFEVGVQSLITKNLVLGAHVFSPGEIGLTEDDNIPSVLRFGLKYAPNDKLELHSEFNKVITEEDEFRVGIQYYLIDQLAIRVGVSTNPSDFSAGFAYKIFDYLAVEGGYSYHPTLGSTPGISIKYNSK